MINVLKKLDYYINLKKMKVYLYDNTSATRGPGAAIIYMSLYMKHQEWKDVDKVRDFVKTHHAYSVPNMVRV